jgi:hypothetical protein
VVCGCGAEQEEDPPLKKALNGMLGLPHTTTPEIATSSSFAVLIAILRSLCWIIVLFLTSVTAYTSCVIVGLRQRECREFSENILLIPTAVHAHR